MDLITESFNNLAHDDSAPLPKSANVTNGGVSYDVPLLYSGNFTIFDDFLSHQDCSTSFHFNRQYLSK